MAGLARGFGPCSTFSGCVVANTPRHVCREGLDRKCRSDGKTPAKLESEPGTLLFLARISGADDSPNRAIQGLLRLNEVMNETLSVKAASRALVGFRSNSA
jgi:hypothetical protein